MLNAAMLLGLLGLSIPVALHLIQRQRIRPQPLATLAFLDREKTANAFAPVPRDRLQLLLRLALLLVFILLMTRLVGCSGAQGPRTLTVILDRSLSMQQTDAAGRSLFERSREHIQSLIDSMRPEDRMNLKLVGDTVELETGFLSDASVLRAHLAAMNVSDGGGLGLSQAVRSAVNRLRGRRDVNAAVLVYSSHRRAHYAHALEEAAREGVEENRARDFRERLERGRVRLVFIDPGEPPPVNVAIERAAFAPPDVFLGSSARFSARIRNYSLSEQTTQVTFFEDGHAGLSRAVTLRPEETVTLDLVHVFENPVDSACHVELTEDGLPGDNRFFLPMRIRDRRQALLVTPHDETAQADDMTLRARGADLFFYALNPGEALGSGAGTFVSVRRVSPEALSRMSLPFYSTVVMYGVDTLDERSAADIAAYVENGGGLYLIPGDETGPARFNRTFAPVLGGFSIGQAISREAGLPLDTLEAAVAEPCLTPLLRGEWGDARNVTVRRYHAVETDGDGRVALRAANGDPLAVMLARGRGRVFVQLFTCSLADSSLPRSAAFVPMVQTVLAALRPDTRLERSETLRAGEMLRVPVPAWRGLAGAGEIEGPATNRLDIVEGDDGPQVRIAGLSLAGPYALRHSEHRTGRRRWVTVNPVSGESDLTPLSAAELNELFGERRFSMTPPKRIDEVFVNRRELAGWLIALLLPAFAVEALTGAWQSRRKSGMSRAGVGERRS